MDPTDHVAADHSYGAVMITETLTIQPHQTVWSLTNATVAASCLHLVAELGVADRLDGPTEIDDLARRCSADPAALDRVLRLLVSHGVFMHQGTRYEHNGASELLRSDHPASLRAFARMMGLPIFGRTFAALHHSIADGSPAIRGRVPGRPLGPSPVAPRRGGDLQQRHAVEGAGRRRRRPGGRTTSSRSARWPTSPAASATCFGPSSTPPPALAASCSSCPGWWTRSPTPRLG